MKVVVVGAGALGSIVGAHLARAGEDVVLVARGERAATLRQRGISLRGLADFTVPVAVATDPREVQTADVLLVTVKTYDTEPALASLRHLCVPSVLSLQNGVLKNEQLARVFGLERVLGAAVVVAGELLDDGAVRFTLNDRFAVGELSGGVSDRARDLAAALVRAGLPAEASPHVQSVEWSKYLLFVGGMALASLTRLPTAKFLSDPDGAMLMARVVRELGDVAARLQIPLDDAGPLPIKAVCSGTLAEAIEHVQRFGARLTERAPAHKISTLQDLERGRRLEVEETLGYAVRKGAELGVPLPAIDTCYRLLSGVNRHIPDRKA
jgi:2-dehydropantoate 2-reductase